MKKRLVFLLIFVILMCLTACNSNIAVDDKDTDVKKVTANTSKGDTAPSNQSAKPSSPAESSIKPSEQTKVLIRGVDVTEKLQLKTIDGILYAEGKSLTEAFALDGLAEYVYEYNEMGEVIYISSYATDVVIFRLYINDTTAERLEDALEDSYRDVELEAPPLYQNDMVWIPVEAFNILDNDIEIKQ